MNFPSRRLQVFISATYDDLIDERQAAVAAILMAKHIPAGMELFTADDRTQWEVITNWIDESDVYIVIIGGRYGSTKDGKSYTQLEYEYALSKGKPVAAYLISESQLLAKVQVAVSAGRSRESVWDSDPTAINAFRSLASTKMRKVWNSPEELKLHIISTLHEWSHRDDLYGWVKSNTVTDVGPIATENARLSKENGELRSQIDSLRINQQPKIAGLTYDEIIEELLREPVRIRVPQYEDHFPADFRNWTLLEAIEYNNKTGHMLDTGLDDTQQSILYSLGLMKYRSGIPSATEDALAFMNILRRKRRENEKTSD